jgi:hypothetical protein
MESKDNAVGEQQVGGNDYLKCKANAQLLTKVSIAV